MLRFGEYFVRIKIYWIAGFSKFVMKIKKKIFVLIWAIQAHLFFVRYLKG